jgi:predicted transcriptional regulator
MNNSEEQYKFVEHTLEYMVSEGIVEKSYRNGETYYNITEEGSALVQITKKKKPMSARRKKSLIMIKK